MDIQDAINRSKNNEPFSKVQLTELLSLPPDSPESYEIMAEARRISRELTENQAEVHAQLALNLAPCPKNCKFCSFAEINKIFKKSVKLSVEDAVHYARLLESEGANSVYVMTTAHYDFGEFIEVSQEEYNTAMAANANVVKDGVAVYEAPVISAEAQAAVDAYIQAGISGNQKLLDLGLTQEEATALTGYVPPSE